MKIPGLLGGLGPEATVIYYKEIISRYRDLTGEDEFPELRINSVNMAQVLRLIGDGRYGELTALLADGIGKLVSAGADFCAISSNTPHIVFDRLRGKVPVPMVSIVEATRDRALSAGCRRLLLIGTLFTMSNDFYPASFREKGITIVVPDKAQQNTIHDIIFPELEMGIVRPEKKAAMLAICTGLIERHHLDGIILGCTELPLILQQADFPVAVLDTARIHVDALVREMLREDDCPDPEDEPVVSRREDHT